MWLGPSQPSSATDKRRNHVPLRKKNQNITPTITKTIRRATRKNASIESIG
jgi:hypothetical protein